MRAIAVVALVIVLAPAPALALTVEEVIGLSKSGVSEEVILAMIERDKTIFTIDSDQLVVLKREGVSEAIVLAMLKSGRQQTTTPTRSSAATDPTPTPTPVQTPAQNANAQSADSQIGPYTVVVGHGPDYPNTFHGASYLLEPTVPVVPYMYYLPLPAFGGGCVPSPVVSSTQTLAGGRFGRFMSDPGARFLNDGAQRFLNNGFITQQILPSIGGCIDASPSRPLLGGHSFRRR